MEKVSSSFKGYKKEFILGPIFKMLEVVFELLTPFLMRYIINVGVDFAIDNGNYTKIIYPSLIIVGFCILGFCSTIVCQYYASIASWGSAQDIRNRLFKKVQSLSLLDVERVGVNNLVTVETNDVNKFQTGIAMAIRLALRAPCIVIGSLICSFILNWKIALIYLAIIPLIMIVYFIVLRISSKQFIKVQKKTDDIVQKVGDSLNGVRVIKAFNKEEKTINEYKKETKTYFDESKKNALLNSIINPFTFLVINVAIVLVVYFSANSIFPSSSNFFIDSGDLVALISYLNQILLAMVVVCNLVVIFTKALASSKRISDVLNIKGTSKNDPKYQKIEIKNGDNLFKFKDVSFTYEPNKAYIISDLNFLINKGQTVGIIGGTGEGKTTLIKLMERFFDASKGTIQYKGVNIEDYDRRSLRDEIGLVSQKSVLFKGTIASNLQIGKQDATEEEMIKALKDACAYDFVSKYDDFLSHEVEEDGKNFSGGQKQRLSIARTLIKNPETLILDDSTSALDYLTEKKLRKNIHDRKNLTSIIITQRIASIKNCDNIFVMYHGKIIDGGTHNELINRCQVYKEIWASQNRE